MGQTESLLPGFALQVAAALRAGVRVAGRAPAGQVLSAAGAGDLGVSGRGVSVAQPA